MPNFGPVHQRGSESRGSPQKVCLGLRGNCYPHPSRDLASSGVLYHHGVASGCHGEKCYPVPGSHKISLPTPSPSDGCVWECRALPRGRMAPSQVGDGPSACPLPSPFPPGRALSRLNRPAAMGAAAREGRRMAGSHARVSVGLPRPVTPNDGLALWCAAVVSGASPSVTPPTQPGRGSQHPAGSRLPAWLFRQRLSPQPRTVG